MILGVDREWRSSVRAACGCWRLGRVFNRGESLVSVELRNEWID